MAAICEFILTPTHHECEQCDNVLRAAVASASGVVASFVENTSAEGESHGGSATRVQEVPMANGLDIMEERGYDSLDLYDRWRTWLDRGDIVIIFENADLGHSQLGHVMTMPWYNDRPLPRCAPDHALTGLGWRYMPRWIVTRSGAFQTTL